MYLYRLFKKATEQIEYGGEHVSILCAVRVVQTKRVMGRGNNKDDRPV